MRQSVERHQFRQIQRYCALHELQPRFHFVGQHILEVLYSTYFDVQVCHLKAESYRDLTPQQIYRQHENVKKRMYASRVMEVEQATCQVYHKRLAELLSLTKGENYSTKMSWIRTRVLFAILSTSLLCLRGSSSLRRVNLDLKEMDFDTERRLLGR